MATANQAQRNDLPEIFQTHEGRYLVENGKSFVIVHVNNGESFCTCAAFTKAIKKDRDSATCKHVEAVEAGIENGGVVRLANQPAEKPQLDPRFIIRIDNQEFCKYQGLLDYAHQKGIGSIEVEPLQLPNSDNGHFAVCKATVVSKNGESYTDIGDANPQNCSSKVGKHLLRLASTRSISRALRSYTNIGMTCLEELADLNDLAENGDRKNESKARTRSTRKPKNHSTGDRQSRTTNEPPSNMPAERNRSAETNPTKGEADSQNRLNDKQKPKMSEAQRKAILNLGHRRGIPMDRLENMAQETFGVQLESMSSKDAAYFIRHLQQQAA